jgi:hypothetical protein
MIVKMLLAETVVRQVTLDIMMLGQRAAGLLKTQTMAIRIRIVIV